MKHTRVSLRVHCIFSTKDRRPSIPEGLQSRTWAFIGGIARNLDMKAIAAGGMADHVHILLLLAPTVPLAVAIQKIKANSSRWLREQTGKSFQWQEGYAAFSVSISHTDATVAYILNQRKHHERRGFDQELAAILKKHRMEE
jgi:REP element-mobilizing transposase RayT